jgi:hypothetical protein
MWEGKEGGAQGKTAFLPPFDRNRGGGGGRGGRPAAGGSPPRHGGGREVGEQREEVEGDSFLASPQAGAACGGRSTAAGGL